MEQLMSTKALERHLIDIMPVLKTNGVTEICINKPQEIYIEKDGTFLYYPEPELTYGFLETLAGLVAEFINKDFPSPLLSGSLPTCERIQFVMNPACENEKIVCSIRRQQRREMSLDDYKASGSFYTQQASKETNESEKKLKYYFITHDILSFIKLAIRMKKNILISGGTGTGKTTLLNACLKVVPKHERIITVEDTREVNVSQSNAAHLLFNEDDPRIRALNMFKACLRLRPDRIFLSELRGAEVWPYLRAANSGHPGSLSTVHADTPEGAITQLMFMMQQAGSTSNEEQIRNYIKSIIHIVVQLKRDISPGHFMYVSDVYFSDA
jgi:type IV secretion system protein VirB11